MRSEAVKCVITCTACLGEHTASITAEYELGYAVSRRFLLNI